MKEPLTSFSAGLLFSLGLGISGMTNPEKVLGFLDVFGNWDPSLVLVMVGGIATYATLFRLISKRSQSLLKLPLHIPAPRKADRPLFIGAAIFGIGWGIAGYCPGPALTSLGAFSLPALYAVVGMGVGMGLFEIGKRRGLL